MASEDQWPKVCRYCDVPVGGPQPWQQHEESESHRRKRALSRFQKPDPRQRPSVPFEFDEAAGVGVCYICRGGTDLSSRNVREQHLAGEQHKKQLLAWRQTAVVGAAYNDVVGNGQVHVGAQSNPSVQCSSPSQRQNDSKGNIPNPSLSSINTLRAEVHPHPGEIDISQRMPVLAIEDDPVLRLSKYVIKNEKNDPTNRYKCAICQFLLNGLAPAKDHLKSEKHKKKERIWDSVPSSHSNSGSVSSSVASSTMNAHNFRNGTLNSEYENIVELGKGAYGKVVKARNKLDMIEYAVKMVQITERNTFEDAMNEVRVLAKISKEHSGIVQYNTCWLEQQEGSGTESGDAGYSETGTSGEDRVSGRGEYLYIAMELCTASLADYLKENPVRRDRVAVLTMFKEIVDAVDFVHSRSMIHRDLKPANIFLTQKNKVKIGDFGLVTEHRQCGPEGPGGQRDQGPTEHTVGQGTELYMAPEQLRSRMYSCEVDIYALGVILVEMLCPMGSRHERGDVLSAVHRSILPDHLLRTHPGEVPLIRQLLHKDPACRPSAAHVREQLTLLLGRPEAEIGVTAPPALG